MNKKKIILSVVFLVVISVLIIFKNDIWGKTTLLGTNKVENAEKKLKGCFLSRTDSSLPKEVGSPHDIKYMEIVKGEGPQVDGLINYLPAEKDSVRGTFLGALQDGYMNIIFSGTGEGEEWKEQKIFRIYDDLVIESEYDEKDLVDGVYVFKDIKKVVFGNNGVFSKVKCGDINKKEVGLE